MTDVLFQFDLAVRILVASVLGAAIGFEREVHGHPAGMRTHLLVGLGSGLFTVLSIFGFPPEQNGATDTSRVAAQIVSGIGFLGAGAIIKEGFSVRGLTTAASLWATAAVGMGAGAAQHILAIVATAIILVSLWPLRRVADRIHGLQKDRRMLEIRVADRRSVAEIAHVLTERRVEIVSLETEEREGASRDVQIGVRTTASSRLEDALREIARLEGVDFVAPDEKGGG